jgi:thiamine-phosphate pyrophosphorylase
MPHPGDRHARLQRAVLYLVCGLRPGARALEDVVGPALAGGVDVVQLRDKQARDHELLAAAAVARRLCDASGALLILNGCHIGQQDMSVDAARALAGTGAIVGLSTHFPGEIDAARDADYIGVGPVHSTPTKPGRPAVGLELVRFAAAHASVTFFAIGGIDASNVDAVVGAGATRIAVVRAITQAADPRAAAAGLRAAVTGEPFHAIA